MNKEIIALNSYEEFGLLSSLEIAALTGEPHAEIVKAIGCITHPTDLAFGGYMDFRRTRNGRTFLIYMLDRELIESLLPVLPASTHSVVMDHLNANEKLEKLGWSVCNLVATMPLSEDECWTEVTAP